MGDDQYGSASGGALYAGSGTGDANITIIVERSTIHSNIADGNHSSMGGAVHAQSGTGDAVTACRFVNATLDANVARSTGSATGGAIYASSGTGEANTNVYVVNATLSGNMADGVDTGRGGAIYASSGTGSAITRVELYSATVVYNMAQGNSSNAGGILLNQGISLSQVNSLISNSILSNNTAAMYQDCLTDDTTLTSGDYNLIGNLSGCSVDGNTGSDMYGVDPLLMPLADNGGPTLTHALPNTSLAVDTGNPNGCEDEVGVILNTDQRGQPRHVGPRCDVGAFEVQ